MMSGRELSRLYCDIYIYTKSGDIPIAKGISPQFMVEGDYLMNFAVLVADLMM